MRKENRYLNLEADLESPPSKPVEEVFENLGLQCGDAATEENSDPQHVNRIDSDGHDAACEDNAVPLTKNSSSEASDIDGEYGTREQIEIRLLGLLHQAIDSNATSVLLGDDGDNLQPKLGKAKAKRAKKAARKEAEIQAGQEVKCSMCNKPFPSKTKLFAHIKGHA
jgi:DnaJ family protein A protein 5